MRSVQGLRRLSILTASGSSRFPVEEKEIGYPPIGFEKWDSKEPGLTKATLGTEQIADEWSEELLIEVITGVTVLV